MLDVTRQSISLWETDQTVPSTANLVRLTEIFGISMDELCGKEPREGQTDAENQTDQANTEQASSENTASCSDEKPVSDEPTEPPVIAESVVRYDRNLLRRVSGLFYDRYKVFAWIAIAYMLFLEIVAICTKASTSAVVVPLIVIFFVCAVLVGWYVRLKNFIESELKLRPNHRLIVRFYHDRFEAESVSDTSTARYARRYGEIKRVFQKPDLILLHFDGTVIPVSKACLGERLPVVVNLFKIYMPKQNRRIKGLLLALFIMSLLSVIFALISTAITLNFLPLPEYDLTMVEYAWIFYLFIPIPLGSTVLGIVFYAKKYKCLKNIIAGVIMTAVLTLYGSFYVLIGEKVYHDFEFVQEIESVLPIDLPDSGYVSYTLDKSKLIEVDAMVKPDDKEAVLKSLERDGWVTKYEQLPPAIVPFSTYISTRNYSHFYLYDLNCKRSNAGISGDHDGHVFIYLAYSKDGNILQITRFTCDELNQK